MYSVTLNIQKWLSEPTLLTAWTPGECQKWSEPCSGSQKQRAINRPVSLPHVVWWLYWCWSSRRHLKNRDDWHVQARKLLRTWWDWSYYSPVFDCLFMIFILDLLQTEADDEWPLTCFSHRDFLNCSHQYKQTLKARTLKCSGVLLHRCCSVDAYLCYSHACRFCISDYCLFTRTSPVASQTCCDVFPLLLTFIFAGCWPAERAASFKANYGHKIDHIKSR